MLVRLKDTNIMDIYGSMYKHSLYVSYLLLVLFLSSGKEYYCISEYKSNV